MLALRKSALHRGIDNALQHFDLLHSQQKATVLIWDKNAETKRWKKIAADADEIKFIEHQNGKHDRFISVNQFYGWRLITLLAELRSCYVDLDQCNDSGTALEALHAAKLPMPNVVMSSGRGLHLYWLHEPLPPSELPQWQLVQNKLCTALKSLGADPAAKDCTRVLRLAGSVNSKNGQVVQGFLRDSQPWKFAELLDAVVPLAERAAKASTSKKAPVRDINAARAARPKRTERSAKAVGRSIYARWYLVLQDLIAIARHHNGIPEGYRNTWLHLCANALSWFANIETIQVELEHFARAWTPDIEESELASVLEQPLKRAAEVKELQDKGELTPETERRYKYKRTTLYSRLEGLITPELETQLRAIISEETHKNREKARLASRDRVKEGRYKQTRTQYLATSQEAQRPWAALGISRTTYYEKKRKGLL